MRLIVFVLLFVAAVVSGQPASSVQSTAAPISGSARSAVVFDGDSFDFSGRHFQLAGIDAPELGQRCAEEVGPKETCGLTAAYELRKRLQLDPRPLRCWPQSESAGSRAGGTNAGATGRAAGETADGAILATCAAAEDDLALVLVESGYARALPDAQIDYRLAEERAYGAGIGLWARDAEAPWDWRVAKTTAGANTPQQGCVIAGTIDQGKKLYYGPLDTDYGKKTVDPTRGERWFCSDDDARAAGWRRPGEQSPS